MGIAGGLEAHTFNINMVARPFSQGLPSVRDRSLRVRQGLELAVHGVVAG
ncbi:hypothetical protein [Streptomyces halobius]|uniref:Uncharacterized protein n=1 Tax=Streptomyces halobius TaxID=2879846 RepID=A0ABY4M4L4_9ACTN|nr:hypothetical protein [Streptomyces halobius]UQA92342.1 hypothetical protein K9S39_11270 [Streptomyces halobius]